MVKIVTANYVSMSQLVVQFSKEKFYNLTLSPRWNLDHKLTLFSIVDYSCRSLTGFYNVIYFDIVFYLCFEIFACVLDLHFVVCTCLKSMFCFIQHQHGLDDIISSSYVMFVFIEVLKCYILLCWLHYITEREHKIL